MTASSQDLRIKKSLTKKKRRVKSWVQKSGESWRRSLEMDKSCNGQQARSLTSQFRESTYRALTLLRRKAKQRQIASKLYRKCIYFFFFKGKLDFLKASGETATSQSVKTSKRGSTVYPGLLSVGLLAFHLIINQICLVHYYKIYMSWNIVQIQ